MISIIVFNIINYSSTSSASSPPPVLDMAMRVAGAGKKAGAALLLVTLAGAVVLLVALAGAAVLLVALAGAVTIWEKIGLQYFYFTTHYALYMHQNISPIAHYMNYFIFIQLNFG